MSPSPSKRRLFDAIVRTVVQFSGREQEDDLTLVVARSR
jgi:serine phosphatase RsbU (regulator of sigma subunit)